MKSIQKHETSLKKHQKSIKKYQTTSKKKGVFGSEAAFPPTLVCPAIIESAGLDDCCFEIKS